MINHHLHSSYNTAMSNLHSNTRYKTQIFNNPVVFCNLFIAYVYAVKHVKYMV